MVLVSCQTEPNRPAQYHWTLFPGWGSEVLKVVFVVATAAPPRRWGRKTAERGGEPWTVWQGFRRSCVAGTGAKLTFFTGGRLGTGGLDTEAGTTRNRPQRGGTAGTTGKEKITGLNLSTETESDLSPIWRIKISLTVGVLDKVLCREEIEEASRHHCRQKLTPGSVKL